MAKEHHPIITGITATVGGGLILAGILGVIGTLPDILGAIASGVSYVFGVLGTPLGLPMWLLVIGLAVIGISTKRRFKRWRDGLPEPIEQHSTEEAISQIVQKVFEPKDPELDDVQTKIMHLFATLDGGQLKQGDISQRLRVSALRVDQALEQLENIALVATDLNFLSGTTYVLTTKGRDFVLERGWVGEK